MKAEQLSVFRNKFCKLTYSEQRIIRAVRGTIESIDSDFIILRRPHNNRIVALQVVSLISVCEIPYREAEEIRK